MSGMSEYTVAPLTTNLFGRNAVAEPGYADSKLIDHVPTAAGRSQLRLCNGTIDRAR
jgi:hypothetical protein